MDTSITTVDLLNQVVGVLPHAGPCQPVLGALKTLLQRAQKLSEDKQKLASIAAQAAKLTLRLSDVVNKNVDHLDEKLISDLDEITGILCSITAEIRRLDTKSGFAKFFLAKSVTDKATRLYDQLQSAVDDCNIVLGIDGAVKLGQTRDIVFMTHDRVDETRERVIETRDRVIETHDRVSDVQTQLRCLTSAQQMRQDDESDFQILRREDLQLLSSEVKSRSIRANTERMVQVSMYSAILRRYTRVIVKKFESPEPGHAKEAFEEELKFLKKTWDPFLIQPFGHSSRNSQLFYIVYHSPSINDRIPLPFLLTQCFEKGDNLIIPLVFSLPKLVQQWVSNIPVYPLEDTGFAIEWGSFDDWIESIAFDSRQLNHSADLVPVYEGELLGMERTTRTSTAVTEDLMNKVFEWLWSQYGDRPLMETVMNAFKLCWGGFVALPLDAKSLSLMSFEDLGRMIQESGWHGLKNKPSLFAHEIEPVLSDEWDWIKGSDRLHFLGYIWDDEIGCHKREQISWWSEFNHGLHIIFCNCEGGVHGAARRWIDHLRIAWPDTPLDGLEHRSADYFEGMEMGNWQVLIPGLLATKITSGTAEIEEISDDESNTDDGEDYHSAEEGDSSESSALDV